jgi:hypothetical protein
VHGEAGIGKSTLLNRAAQVATQSGLRVLVVRCAGEGQNTFGPWQRIFGAVGGGNFDTFVRAHAGDLVTAVAQAIAARLTEPAALIVDDVHELTGEALDIFVALSQMAISGHAIIAGARPEGVLLFRSRLADIAIEDLPIGRLDRSNMQWALAQALGGEQPDVLKVLYDRTGGHPLFFTGLLNSLVDVAVLKRDGHRWQLAKAIDDDIELPDTVRRFIETRLHARGEASGAVACALALEPGANSDDLAAVLRFDESTTLDALDDLLALGLITQPPSGAQFAFTHDLIREVAGAGLNAGRRTSLHRAFAQRLETSGQVDGSLRLARHLQAAGDPLSAAKAYLKSAEAALELNAAQDANEYCDVGVREAEKLERTATRDVLLATLHRTAARAAVANGNADGAIGRARDAVNFARSAENLHESIAAVLSLAAMEGAAFHSIEQKSDSAVAAESARLCGDDAMEAQALVQLAAASRELGLQEGALQAGHSAHGLALKCGRPEIAVAALEEILRAQITWWSFNDALMTARTGLDGAKLLQPFVEAGFLHARCGMWYLLRRFDEAESELRAALRIANESVVRRHESLVAPVHPQPYLQFACHYMTAKIALAQEQFNQGMEAADKAAALTTVAKLPRYSEPLALLRIDALLRRNLPGDSKAAHDLTTTLGESTVAQGTIGWSDCVELARACVAARLRMPDASTKLLRAVDALEENAHRALLDADVAFARLAEAAAEIDENDITLRARARATYYGSRRLASAGTAWGGSTHSSMGPALRDFKGRV